MNIISWNGLSSEEENDRVIYEKPDLSQFMKIAEGVYMIGSDSDLAFSQMLEHTRPRDGSVFQLLMKDEGDFGEFELAKRIGLTKISQYEEGFIKEAIDYFKPDYLGICPLSDNHLYILVIIENE
jgi:hypothetical protein